MKLSIGVLKGIKICLLAILLCYSASVASAQQKQTITGKIMDIKNDEAVIYATVALFDSTGFTLTSGGVTNMDGEFEIGCESKGKHILRISAIGYETKTDSIDLSSGKNIELGVVALEFADIAMMGVTVTGERVKAKTGPDQTTFFVDRKMHEASNTGVDILKLIPGIQLDFRQNISLEGSQNIIILIDGKERDRSFVSQLNAGQIDRVEVISNPPSKYDAGVTGVINVILVKDRERGMDGQVYAEVPTSDSEIYLFPVYNLNYGFNKLNLFTSYNGELSYFDIHESVNRKIISNGVQDKSETVNIVSNQYVRQKNWSHKFHYGFDYFINEKNQLNFYAFYNTSSREHDGIADMYTDDSTANWFANKEDTDINHSSFYSLFYKHMFNEASGHALDVDISHYNLQAENITSFINEESGYNQVNAVRPENRWASFRIDYFLPVTGRLKFNSGIRSRLQDMENGSTEQFKFYDRSMAGYMALSYRIEKFDVQAGLRFKHYTSGLAGGYSNTTGAFLPNISANYSYSTTHNFKFSYRSSISFPNFYQLNPYRSIADPFSVYSGNPDLKPMLRKNFSLEHSLRPGNNFISTRFFYNINSDVINNLTLVNDDNVFESGTYNSGDIRQYGIQLSGALNITKRFAINPYLRVFEVNLLPNDIARRYNVGSRKKTGWDSGFSAVATFNNEITASVMFQYSSPLHEIQGNSFSGALYFLSVEKSFGRGFKAGLVSGVPLAGSLVYQGSEIDSDNFYSHSSGNIKMSVVPLWLKFSYRFSTGKKREKINRQKEEIESLPGKGF